MTKTRNWLLLLLIGLCLMLFLGYRIMDHRNTDTQPPEIAFSGELLQLSVQDPKDALLQGASASDDRDGDVSASLVVEKITLTGTDGSILVKYAAFDRAGNVTKAERSAKYTDYQSPRFALRAPMFFAEKSNFDILNIIDAADALDGNISHRIRTTSMDSSTVTSLGSHLVEFRVTNSLGDTVRLTLPVEVYPSGAYSMNVTLTDYLIYLDANSSFQPGQYLDSVTRNRETVSLRGRLPENYAVKTVGSVDTRTPGVYAVDYIVTYTVVNEFNPENSQVSTGCTRLIVVVEG